MGQAAICSIRASPTMPCFTWTTARPTSVWWPILSITCPHMPETTIYLSRRDNILAALQIAFERGMQAELVRGVNAFSHFLLARALYSLAEQHLERAYQAARTLNNPQAIVTTLLHLGRTAEWQGNYTRAETYLQEGLSLAQQIDDREQIAAALHELGEVAYRSQNNARAELYY